MSELFPVIGTILSHKNSPFRQTYGKIFPFTISPNQKGGNVRVFIYFLQKKFNLTRNEFNCRQIALYTIIYAVWNFTGGFIVEEKILEFILEYAEEQKLVPFSVIEEEFNLVIDDSLKSVIADALWDNDTVSDVFIETDGFTITFFEN